MQVLPLKSVASQSFSAVLGNQNCQITLSQKTTGVIFSLTVANVPVVSGRIVREGAKIVRVPYSDFQGDFLMIDTQGNDDPQWDGLGDRWQLVYVP